MEQLEDRYLLAVISIWTGAGDGNSWSDVRNWGNGVPQAYGDQAIFEGTVSNANAFQNIAPSITLSQLTITAGYFGTIQLNNPIVLKDGTSEMDTGAILGGNQTLELATPSSGQSTMFNWSNGNMDGPNPSTGSSIIKVDQSAVLNISSAGTFLGRSLDNFGTVNVSVGNDIKVYNKSNITNEGNTMGVKGTIDIQVDYGFVLGTRATAGTISNNGTFKKSAGTGTTTIGLPFTTSGTNGVFQIQTGTVNFTSSASQGMGITTIFNNATLATTTEFDVNAGAFSGGASSTVRGNLTVSGGDVYPGAAGTIGTLNVTNNYTMTGGTLEIDNNISGGQIDALKVTNQLKLQSGTNNAGTVTINNMNGTPTNGQTFTIITYGTMVGDFATKNGSFGTGHYDFLPNKPNGPYQIKAVLGMGAPSLAFSVGATRDQATTTDRAWSSYVEAFLPQEKGWSSQPAFGVDSQRPLLRGGAQSSVDLLTLTHDLLAPVEEALVDLLAQEALLT